MILGDLVQAFSGLSSIDAFQTRLTHEVGALGFNHLTLGFLPRKLELAPAMPQNISTYPVEWLQRYEQNRYLFVDPAISRPLHNPYQWFLWHDRQGLNPMENRILDEAAEYGLRVGLCLPTATRSSFSLIGLGWDGEVDEFNRFLGEHRSHIWMLANVAQCMALQQFGSSFPYSYRAVLDPQQRDLLRWLSDGHSMEAIADRMNLSIRSVQQRIGSVCLALGVESPTEALVVARDLWVS